MTVFLRALYGPFGEDIVWTVEPTERRAGVPARLDWFFFGIREDNQMARWALCFDVKKRRYKAHGLGDCIPFIRRAGGIKSELVHPDAFVLDGPMIYGPKMTDILRSRLTPAQIARASALAITVAR